MGLPVDKAEIDRVLAVPIEMLCSPRYARLEDSYSPNSHGSSSNGPPRGDKANKAKDEDEDAWSGFTCKLSAAATRYSSRGCSYCIQSQCSMAHGCGRSATASDATDLACLCIASAWAWAWAWMDLYYDAYLLRHLPYLQTRGRCSTSAVQSAGLRQITAGRSR
jgi:hypothetical protein|eukprot:COSAG06_NODE_875_length_11812_cov_5.166539_4_plen_164_part_00